MTERDAIREGMRRMLRDAPADPVPVSRLAMPRIPRYDIGPRIGEGAMAVVHRARDRELQRDVAIKILRDAAGAGRQTLDRFHREARTAAGFSHPGVAAVYDAGEADGSLYLVMELVDGRPLTALIEDPARKINRVVALLEEASRGVGAAHERGIVHRDLKPANILVSDDGHAKVVDFGIAHVIGAEAKLTQAGTVMGTPLYMAPEQVKGSVDRISPRTDVYALGAILYEILTGRTPHVGGNMTEIFARIVGEETRSPAAVKPGLPRDLSTVAMKALEKEPERRYADAREFADDLKRYLDGDPVHAVAVSVTRRWARRAGRRPLPWIAGAAAAGAVLLSLVVATRSGRQLDRKEQAAEISAAYFDLALSTLKPMADLEDAWQDARADLDRDAALAEIDAAVRRVAARHPAARVPAAWRGLALYLAGRPGRELEEACEGSDADPFPHIFLARAMMARYARDAELEWAWPQGEAAPAPRFVESPAMADARGRADAAIARALSMDLWPLLDHGGELRTYARGAAELGARRYGAAAEQLAALAEVPLLKSEASLLQGFALYLSGRFREAAAAWRIPASRGWPKALYLQALATGVDAVSGGSKDPRPGLEAARALFDRLVERNWDPRRTRLFRGLLREFEGEILEGRREDAAPAYRAAIADFDAAIEADTKNDWPWFYRAKSALALAMMDLARGVDASAGIERAIADYGRAIEAGPGSPMNHYGRAAGRDAQARAAVALGRDPLPALELAAADLDAALALNANFVAALAARADVRRRLGRHAAALADYDALAAKRPPDAALHAARGEMLEALGRPVQAIEAYEAAAALAPGNEELTRKIRELRGGQVH